MTLGSLVLGYLNTIHLEKRVCTKSHNYMETLLKVYVTSSVEVGSKDRLHMLS